MLPGSRVVVIGGGVSGLATAYFLRSGGEPAPEVCLVEESPRLGGKVRTRVLSGLPVDTGPDTLVVRDPSVRALLDELDLRSRLVPPAARGAYLWSRGRLRPLPDGMELGVPGRLWPLLRSRVLSPTGLLRAGLGLLRTRNTVADTEPSVGEVVRSIFGPEVLDRLVAPLMAGRFAGSPDMLSARLVAPQLLDLLRPGQPAYPRLRALRGASGGTTTPSTMTLPGGLEDLVEAMRQRLDDCDLRTGVGAVSLTRHVDRYVVTLADGTSVDADAVVLATPAFVSADLLHALSPAAANDLREIRYASTTTVTLAYPGHALRRPLDATGFLVPPSENRLVTACTWSSAKWPHLSGPDLVLLRCSLGNVGWCSTVDDETVVRHAHSELAEAMGITQPPTEFVVSRWPRALPEYTLGHGDRLRRVAHALRDLPGVFLTGAACGGAGLAQCLSHARRTADTLRATLPVPVSS